MSLSAPTYPSYKATGVPWLGDVPEHWDLIRGKWLFRSRKVINADGRNTNILSLTLRGVVNNDPDNPEGLVPKDYASYQVFEAGDLVFKLIDLENLRTSRVGLVHEEGIMSPAYVRLTPMHGGDQRYFYYQYYDLYQRGIYNQLGAGVRSTLSASDLLDVEVLVPTAAEQAAIVRFLRYAELRLRGFAKSKQRMIALLDEQKQTMIHQAVTRGLDPTVPRKSSGIDWQPDVPEHWRVMPIKRAFASMDYGISESAVDDGAIRLLTMGHIRDGRVTVPDTGGVEDVPAELLLRRDDLLFNRTNSAALVGKVGLFAGADGPVTFASYLVRMRPRQDHDPAYLNLVLNDRGALAAARREAIPSLHQSNLNPTRYGRLPIALPPLDEQRAIVVAMQQATQTIDDAVDRARREVSLIGEFWTRLAADAVTGKLDVRSVAKTLPDLSDAMSDAPSPITVSGQADVEEAA